ncbi:MAG: dimethylarginine dimethylaminohydrolase [Rhodobacteraceae bacterium]|nr:dimethylarginine dimethylaminohydrolase [Paracoccaceae bacterium]
MTYRKGLSWHFSHAITRQPADSVCNGLRADERGGDPSAEAFRREHAGYVRALEAAGLKVDVLPQLEEYPDSCFVEDPAFCLPDGAIVLRPGAESRKGETTHIRAGLEARFDRVVDLPGEGFVDGGDVLMMDDEIIIGLSARTNSEGAEAFSALLESWGYAARVVETPAGVLHFKTACSTLGDGVVLATRTLASSRFFDGRKVVEVPEGEETAANAIRVNDVVLVSEGFPKTVAAIEVAGFTTVVLPTYEAAKVDGGLSCLSLRFNLQS